MRYSEKELKSISHWFGNYCDYPVTYRKGDRVHITVGMDKEITYACMSVTDVYKEEYVLPDVCYDLSALSISSPTYEMELTGNGFMIHCNEIIAKGYTLLMYKESYYFEYEKEVLL